jgi:hypothetical protein
MAILTHNRGDFQRLALDYFQRDLTHAGIIIAVRRSPYDIAQRLGTVLNQITADELADQVLYI